MPCMQQLGPVYWSSVSLWVVVRWARPRSQLVMSYLLDM